MEVKQGLSNNLEGWDRERGSREKEHCLLIFSYLPSVECKLYKDGDFCPFCLLLYPQPGM